VWRTSCCQRTAISSEHSCVPKRTSCTAVCGCLPDALARWDSAPRIEPKQSTQGTDGRTDGEADGQSLRSICLQLSAH
jgi:hypothetical protein